MASTYALPLAGGTYDRAYPHQHYHSHSHSHSPSHSNSRHSSHAHSYSHAPSRSTNRTSTSSLTFVSTNSHASHHRHQPSNPNLYTHPEHGRETSPQSRLLDGWAHNASDMNEKHASHTHNNGSHLHSDPHRLARSRAESDLGFRHDTTTFGYQSPRSTDSSAGAAALTGILLCIPYVLAAAAFSSGSVLFTPPRFPPLAAFNRPQQSTSTNDEQISTELKQISLPTASVIIQAATMTSATLILVGILAKLRAREQGTTHEKGTLISGQRLRATPVLVGVKSALLRASIVGLPFYASMQLGGARVASCLLIWTATSVEQSHQSLNKPASDWLEPITRFATGSIVMLLCLLVDLLGWTLAASTHQIMLGYVALALSAFVLWPALSSCSLLDLQSSSLHSPDVSAISPLVRSDIDISMTLVTGLALSAVTIAASAVLSISPPITISAIGFNSGCIASMAAAILCAKPQTLQSHPKLSCGLACGVTAACAFLFSPDIWPGTIVNGGFSALTFLSILHDLADAKHNHIVNDHGHSHGHNHDHSSHSNSQAQIHMHTAVSHSVFTKFILSRCEPGSLVHGILSEKDSRRIAYFTLLNFAFMLVQGVYGYLSGSLGLLSDTVHMFFDCLGLIVGLGAAVASKWPISPDMPYGWGKLNTLAGFGNGIFLMLVSVEFVWEAVEGIREAKELQHVQELLVVSVLGFLVNMVGLLAFGHVHAGHDHGHSHGSQSMNTSHDHQHHAHDHGHDHVHPHDHHHEHAYSNGHAHDHVHQHDHSRSEEHKHGPDCSASHGHVESKHAHGHAHTHSHDHHNENMHGIFLHVAADAGGSLAVILSTTAHLYRPWHFWDPLATIIIAILIFAMAIPLVTSSAQKLLLVIPDEAEYSIKNTLQELGEVRGVVGFAASRFWLDDKDAGADGHDHHHHHGYDHGHSHEPAKPARMLGTIHVSAASNADLEDVRVRVEQLFVSRGMDIVVQVERDDGSPCWCRTRVSRGSLAQADWALPGVNDKEI